MYRKKVLGNVEVDKYLILETGFFFYFLSLYLKDNRTSKNPIKKPKDELTFKQKVREYLKGTVIDSFCTFAKDLSIDFLATIGYIVSGILYVITVGSFQKWNLLRALLKWHKYVDDDCYKFYKRKLILSCLL